MKKIFLLSFLISSLYTQAQTGIGTASPEAMLHIVNASNDTNALKIEGLSTAASTEAVETLVIDIDGVVKTKTIEGATSTMPKFFYMPSVALPVTPEMVAAMGNTNITYDAGTYSVNLHAIFSSQFSTPVIKSSTTASLNGFVLNDNQYEYFVTSADTSVFTVTELSETGVLKYTVNANAIVRNSSFMNIVLKVK